MSGHLIGCAGAIQGIGKSQKLALVAFADSADDRTHIAFPGYEGVMAWASCSRSRAAELINDLEAAGYLLQHRTARPGRRAEYVVFPGGCCDLHRTPETEPRPSTETVLAWAADAGVTLEPWQAQAMAAHPGAHLPDDTDRSEISDSNASEISDPSGGDRSEISDPSTSNGSEISVRVQNGSRNGSETLDPFTTSLLDNPPTPLPAIAVGIGRRGSGTSPREARATRDRLDAEARRRALQAAQRIRAAAAAAAAVDAETNAARAAAARKRLQGQG